jgi:glutamate-1-semialdehyde 2,1-aminomutase
MHDHGDYPHHVESVDGAWFTTVDGQRYVDWFGGGGVTTLGHRHPLVQAAMHAQIERGVHLSLHSALEVEVAEVLCGLFAGAEQVAFGKNGSDVTTAAIRLARTVTRRPHVLTCGYHGWLDWAKAPSADVTGIPDPVRALTHEFDFGDTDGAARLLAELRSQVAAIVVEPIRHDLPPPTFLPDLRRLADEHGCVLVFDEVVTGLRVHRGGAQTLFGVRPDLTCLAKSLANGLPLSALLGPRRLMQHLPPAFFALTYAREALSLAAARATLAVHQDVNVASHIAAVGERVRTEFAAAAARHELPWTLRGHPGLMHMDIRGVGRLLPRGALTLFIECMQREGIYLAPFRVLPSLAHGGPEIARTAQAFEIAMRTVRVAASTGLTPHLDSPVWSDFELPGNDPPPAPPASTHWTPSGSWSVPADMVARGAQTTLRGAARLVADAGPRMVLGPQPRGGSSEAAIDILAPLDGDGIAVVEFHVEPLTRGNARLTLAVAGHGVGTDEWNEIQFHLAFGHSPQAAAWFGKRYTATPTVTDGPCIRLELRRRQNRLAAHHDGAGPPIADVPVSPVPLRIRLACRLVGAARMPVAVVVQSVCVSR